MAVFNHHLRITFLHCFFFAVSSLILSNALFRSAHAEEPEVHLTASEYEFIDENHISIILPFDNNVYEIIETNVQDDDVSIDPDEVNNNNPPVATKPKINPKVQADSIKLSLRVMVWPVILDDEFKILELIEKDISTHLANNNVKPDVLVLKLDSALSEFTYSPKIEALFKTIRRHSRPDSPALAQADIKRHILIQGDILVISMWPVEQIPIGGYSTYGRCLVEEGVPAGYFSCFSISPKKGKAALFFLSQRQLDRSYCTSCMWKQCLNNLLEVLNRIYATGLPVAVITTNLYYPVAPIETANLLKVRYLKPANTNISDFTPKSNRLAREMVVKLSGITSYEPVQAQNLFFRKTKDGRLKIKHSHRVLPLRSPKIIYDPVEALPFYWSSFFSSYWGQELYDYSPFYPSYFVIQLFEEK